MGCTGCVSAGALGVSAGVEPVALVDAGPEAGLAAFVAGVDVSDVRAGEVTGVRLEAGSARTPRRYASAMAVTNRT